MDYENAGRGDSLSSRPPTIEDLRKICGALNNNNAKYILIGGLAMNYHGFSRSTADIDFLVDTSPENIKKVIDALACLPDKASLEMEPEDVSKYTVVRVADEVVVDLLGSVGDVLYDNSEFEIWELDRLRIPVGTVDTLIRTKQGIREKDKTDLTFLLLLKHSQDNEQADEGPPSSTPGM